MNTRSKVHRIAVLGGDGIGPEVVAEACEVLQTIAELDPQMHFEFTVLDWGTSYYLRHGQMLPEAATDLLCEYDAILLGAVGDPRVPDDVTLWGMLLPIRQRLNQYVNLRPVRLLPGVNSPLVAPGNGQPIDMIIVRENSEGEYAGKGFFLGERTPLETAVQMSVFSRPGVERILRYAFELAKASGRTLTSISKGNALNYTGVFWDRMVAEVSKEYPEVSCRQLLVDAAALHMLRDPASFEVVVASNLFGDILSDLAAGIVGGLGLAPSANLNPEHDYPSMFEPVHGSAPDIAGTGRANPIAAIWAGAMLVGHLGHPLWESKIVDAIQATLAAGVVLTPDLGGIARTHDVTKAIIGSLRHDVHAPNPSA